MRQPRPWYAVAGAGLIVGASLLAIGANLPRGQEATSTAPRPAAAVTYTVTATPAPTDVGSIPVPCRQSITLANTIVKDTEALGLIYSRNQTIITDTHVAIAIPDVNELNRLASEQNTLYNEVGPLNDVLARDQLLYDQVQRACLSALH